MPVLIFSILLAVAPNKVFAMTEFCMLKEGDPIHEILIFDSELGQAFRLIHDISGRFETDHYRVEPVEIEAAENQAKLAFVRLPLMSLLNKDSRIDTSTFFQNLEKISHTNRPADFVDFIADVHQGLHDVVYKSRDTKFSLSLTKGLLIGSIFSNMAAATAVVTGGRIFFLPPNPYSLFGGLVLSSILLLAYPPESGIWILEPFMNVTPLSRRRMFKIGFAYASAMVGCSQIITKLASMAL